MLPVVFVPLLVVAGATTVLQLSFASCCVSNERSIHHRRDDVNAGKTKTLSGEKSASESSSGRSKRCLQNASERRSIARDWSKWSVVEVLVDKGSFEGLCSVRLTSFVRALTTSSRFSLSLSLRV